MRRNAGKQEGDEIKQKDYLSDRLHVTGNVRLEKMQETIRVCIDEMRRQSSGYEERTGFWTYLSDVFRFEGLSVLGLQMLALLASCLGIIAMPDIPAAVSTFVPLLALAFMPVLYRSQAYGMCEMEAATRASGAQIVLARLILAGAAELLCMTALLCVEISVSGTTGQIVQMILYIVVPFLVSMVELLHGVRMCRYRKGETYMTVSLLLCLGWGVSAKLAPWLYETSATGLWIVGLIVFAAFFIREVCYIVRMWKEGKMYGIIG